MGRTFVLVPSAGTVKLAGNSYTDGADVKVDEVTVLGEQHLPTYAAVPTALSNIGTANKHLAQLMAGVSLNVYVRWIGVYQFAGAAAAQLTEMRLLRLTTAGTTGAAGAVNPLDTTAAAAGATFMTMPTVLGTEGAVLSWFYWGSIAASAAFPIADGSLVWQWPPRDDPRAQSIRIPAGTTNGIAIKNVTAIATATFAVNMLVSEAPY